MLEEATQDLLLVAPYVKSAASDQLLELFQRRRIQATIKVGLITSIRADSIIAGTLDVDALVRLADHLPHFTLTHLPSLHAKVYIADDRAAVVTSGNLTDGGLHNNIEYGTHFIDQGVVREIRQDFERYASLGTTYPAEALRSLAEKSAELRTAYRALQRSMRAKAQRVFRERLQETSFSLLRQRAQGKTTHAILCDTLLFLLERGPLATRDIHPLVQQIHPDICDDAIERVIDGVYFGKKWKHHVRSAQQALVRQAKIRFDGTRWHLIGGRDAPRPE